MVVRDSHQVYEGYAKLFRKDDGSYAVFQLWYADSPNQRWPVNQFNADQTRHTWGVPGF